MQPRLVIEQKITPIVNKYEIHKAANSGEKAGLVAFAQQKRLAFKEKVKFYSDTANTEEIFGFRAEKVVDVHGRYFVENPAGVRIGAFRKIFAKSLINSTWEVIDEDDTALFRIRENNMILAVLRRFVGFIPIVGEFAEIITWFFRFHFEIIDCQTDQVVGEYRKTTLFRDHYLLSVTDEAYRKDDWRTFAAVAVALDALQSR